MRLVGYARTSTLDQQAGLDAQIRDLTDAGADVIFNEQVSSVGERPEFEAAMADLRPGDRLVVCKVDRLARSTAGLLEIVEKLEKMGVGLRILNLGGDVVDTKSATGKLILTIFAGFAQFEREMMLERQREGIAKARAEGKYKGSPPNVDRINQVIAMKTSGMTVTDLAAHLGVSRRQATRILSSHGLVRERRGALRMA